MNNTIDFGGRKQLFKALVGSHNYNMNTSDSDKDYKIFALPTFDDLYSGIEFSKSYVGETEDIDVHDVRKVGNLWWKANINFVEVLFSEDIEVMVDTLGRTARLLNEIFSMKNEIARMNLPYFYDACIGMHLNKRKMVGKGTAGTQHLVDKFGYDTKQAMHSLRVLDFLARFADRGFKDFKSAIWYKDGEFKKSYLLALKNGEFEKETYLEVANVTIKRVEDDYKEVYKSQLPNKETKEHLLRLVKDIVREELE